MSKAVKLRNSIYLSSESIIHKRGGGWYYLTNILDNIYPVGSIFITMNNTNPSEYFGGKWEKISGGYLYATGSNSLGKTTYIGWGAQSTTLTIDQIPPHTHSYYGHYGYNRQAASTLGWNLGDTDYNDYKVSTTGGGQGHTHNIATIDVWMWKRVS